MEKIKRLSKRYLICLLITAVFATLIINDNIYFSNETNMLIKGMNSININKTSGKLTGPIDEEKNKLNNINQSILYKLRIRKKYSEMFFLEACKDLNEDNYDKAEENLKKSIEYSKKSTSTLSKIYSSRILAQIYMSRKEDFYAVKTVSDTLDKLNENDINKYYREIIGLLDVLGDNQYKYDEIILWGKRVLYDYKNIKDEAKLYINFRLKDLYIERGDYASATEHVIRAYYRASELKNDYYMIYDIIDFADIYRRLGFVEESIDFVEKALEMRLKDDSKRRYIEARANLSLAESYSEIQEIEKAKACFEKVYERKDSLTGDELKTCIFSVSMIYSEFNFNENNIEEGKKNLDYAYNIVKDRSDSFEEYMYMEYCLSYASYLKLIGREDEAIEICNEILAWCETADPYRSKKIIKRFISSALGYADTSELFEIFTIPNIKEDAYKSCMNYIEESVRSHMVIEKDRQKINIIYEASSSILIISIVMFLIYNSKLKKLRTLNERDGLTKVYNRLFFDIIYKEYLKKEVNFGLIMIDIDNFKSLNDTYGHQFGDEVLIRVCRIIMKNIGDDMKLSRYGGEEFIITAKNKSKEEIEFIADAIRRKVEIADWDEDVKVTISAGVAVSSENGKDTLNKADKNLYEAKSTGKNKVVV